MQDGGRACRGSAWSLLAQLGTAMKREPPGWRRHEHASQGNPGPSGPGGGHHPPPPAPMSITAASGFVAAGIAAGIKASGRSDLALVATADRRPVPAAGVFTTNLVAAAPVQVSRRHLAARFEAAAVVLN